jgi:hypothetical protein
MLAQGIKKDEAAPARWKGVISLSTKLPPGDSVDALSLPTTCYTSDENATHGRIRGLNTYLQMFGALQRCEGIAFLLMIAHSSLLC